MVEWFALTSVVSQLNTPLLLQSGSIPSLLDLIICRIGHGVTRSQEPDRYSGHGGGSFLSDRSDRSVRERSSQTDESMGSESTGEARGGEMRGFNNSVLCSISAG